MFPFCTPQKTSAKLWFSGPSSGFRNGILARNWLICEQTLKEAEVSISSAVLEKNGPNLGENSCEGAHFLSELTRKKLATLLYNKIKAYWIKKKQKMSVKINL